MGVAKPGCRHPKPCRLGADGRLVRRLALARLSVGLGGYPLQSTPIGVNPLVPGDTRHAAWHYSAGLAFRAEHAHLPRTLRQFELVQRFHHRPIAPSLGGVSAYVGVPGEHAGLVAVDCVCPDGLVEVGVAANKFRRFLVGEVNR